VKTSDFKQFGIIGSAAVLAFVILVACNPALAGKPDPTEAADLASVGEVRPNAIDLKVSMERPRADQILALPAVIRLRVAEKAHLTVMYLTLNGDALVLLPNRDMPQSLLQPGSDYTLFGPDSKVKLKESDTAKGGKLVLYVSSIPFRPEPLSTMSEEPYVRIPLSAEKQRKVLIEKIETLAKAPGFNRKIVSLTNGEQKSAPLDLMGLPPDVKTTKPVGVTGVQGEKTKIPDSKE